MIGEKEELLQKSLKTVDTPVFHLLIWQFLLFKYRRNMDLMI